MRTGCTPQGDNFISWSTLAPLISTNKHFFWLCTFCSPDREILATVSYFLKMCAFSERIENLVAMLWHVNLTSHGKSSLLFTFPRHSFTLMWSQCSNPALQALDPSYFSCSSCQTLIQATVPVLCSHTTSIQKNAAGSRAALFQPCTQHTRPPFCLKKIHLKSNFDQNKNNTSIPPVQPPASCSFPDEGALHCRGSTHCLAAIACTRWASKMEWRSMLRLQHVC